MATLLDALLRNESGGRNVTNVDATTSSGRARGYFQITDGTWREFGGTRYAPNALGASYAQQAEIASRIPLKRWDRSTIALMRATGRPLDVNRTLGENLAMNRESFANARIQGGGKMPSSPTRPADQFWPDSGQAQLAASQGIQAYDTANADSSLDNSGPPIFDAPPAREENLGDIFAKTFGKTGAGGGSSPASGGLQGDPGGDIPPLDYASAVPQPTQPLGTDLSPLAELFNIKNIGQAPAMQAANPIRGF